MENSYWEFEDGLWYYVGDVFTTRYKLDFENKVVIEQYNLMGEWEDGSQPVSFISFPPTLEEAKLCVEDGWKNKKLEEKEFYDSLWAEMAEEDSRRLQERDSWKERLKGLIKVKKLWKELEEETESWWIEGIVEITLTDEQPRGYSKKYQSARIKSEKGYLYTDWDGDGVFNWQQTGYLGDDYSGYLLYPLKDGRYLKVSYSC